MPSVKSLAIIAAVSLVVTIWVAPKVAAAIRK